MSPRFAYTGKTGGRWVLDERQNAGASRRTKPFYGWAEDDETFRIYAQQLVNGDTFPDDLKAGHEADQRHMRTAFETAQIPEIKACPYIAEPIDYVDGYDTYLIHRRADDVLDEHIRKYPLTARESDEIGHNLYVALNVIHSLGLAHCDVREDNVLLVGGVWSLGDLGSVTELGAPIRTVSKDPEYRLDGVSIGSPATIELDGHGLAVVIRHLTNR